MGKKPAAVPKVKQLFKMYLENNLTDGVPFTALQSAIVQSSTWQLLICRCSLPGGYRQESYFCKPFPLPSNKREARSFSAIKLPRLGYERSCSSGQRHKGMKYIQGRQRSLASK